MINGSNLLKQAQNNLERYKMFSNGRSPNNLGEVQLQDNVQSGIEQINQMSLMRAQAQQRLKEVEDEKLRRKQEQEQQQIQDQGQKSQREQMARINFIGSTDQPANVSTEFGPAYQDEQGKYWVTKDTNFNRINIDLPKFVGQTENPSNMSTEAGPAYADQNNRIFITKDTFGGDQQLADNIQVNQQFGNPNESLYGPGGWNRGVDIAAKPGEPQYAPPQGNWVVESAYSGNDFNTGWGRSVVIKNQDTGETIRRSHLDQVDVKPGDVVTGQVLGTTGRTGRTTGYHKDVEYTDPSGQLQDYMKSPYVVFETPKGKMEALKRLVFKEAQASEGDYPMAPLMDNGMVSPQSQEEVAKNWYQSLERNATEDNNMSYLDPKNEKQIASNVSQNINPKYQKNAQQNIPKIIQALKDENISDPKTIAYALATIEHETGGVFSPIEEYMGRSQAKKLGYNGGENYFGRGFIQLTHKDNYEKIGKRIGIPDLADNPEKALDPDVSAKILAAFFKDRGVADLASKGNFYGARSPINGTDKAKEIAQLAKKYLKFF